MDLLSFKRIFHPSDLSEASNIAFAHAIKLSLLTKAELDVLHVAENVKYDHFPKVRELLEKWQLLPKNSQPEDLQKIGLIVKKIGAADKDPVPWIKDYLATKMLDMVVLTTHQKKGFTRWLDKSISEPIARQTKGVTLFIPEGIQGFIEEHTGEIKLRNIIIPIAKEPNPQFAVDFATHLAFTCGLNEVCFTLIYVGTENERPDVDIEERDGWQWQKIVEKGNLVEKILAQTSEKQGDLIVMSTKGHDGFLDMLRGSNTEQVLRNSKCPVVAIPVA